MNKETINNLNELSLLQKAGVFTLLCLGLLALTGVWFMYKSFAHQDVKTFSVQGKGEVDVQATKATINADFVGEGNTAEAATEKLSIASTKVFSELEKIGVKKENIKTQSVSTNPKYDYCYNYTKINMPDYCRVNPNEGKIVGFTAAQNFEVKVTNNKELVEKLLGLFPTLGARSTNGPMWEVDNKQATQQARELAVKEAKEKAQGIAKSLGMRLGEVQYYNEDQGGGYPIMYGKASVMNARAEMAPQAMDMAVPVSQGTDKVIVNVNITYELN